MILQAPRKLKSGCLSLLGLLCLPIVLGAFLYCRHFSEDAGVTLYVEAARCMLDGKPLQTCNPFYTYPPIVALLTIPLVPLPLVLQNIVWYALTIGGLLWGMFLIVPLAQRLSPSGWSMRELVLLYGVGIALSLKFVFAAIASQSYDVLVVLFILIGLANLAKDWPNNRSHASLWAGLSFGCAAALKATPLLFLPYLIVRRHYCAAVAMAIALVSLSLLPDLTFALARKSGEGYLLAWLQQVAHPALTEKINGNLHTFWVASNTNNNSLRGLVGAVVSDGTPAFSRVLYTVYAVYALVVGVIILATGKRTAAITIDGALLLMSMLLLSPMSSESHYVALGLPIFGATAMWLKGDDRVRETTRYCLIISFLLINAAARDIVGMEMTTWAKDHRLLVVDVLLLIVPYALLVRTWQPLRSFVAGVSPANHG
jgi:Glycosyltransferase family 87